MAHGGYRPGAGRKKKADEDKVRNLAIDAIVAKYGGEKQGMLSLLDSGEASLIKYVFEHAFGKPTDKVQHTGDPDAPINFSLDERFLKQIVNGG